MVVPAEAAPATAADSEQLDRATTVVPTSEQTTVPEAVAAQALSGKIERQRRQVVTAGMVCLYLSLAFTVHPDFLRAVAAEEASPALAQPQGQVVPVVEEMAGQAQG